MSLSTNISNLATRIATELKAVRTLVNGNAADLSSLTTTNKTNLVAALNEVKASVASAGVQINDSVSSTSSVWSSTKTSGEITAAVAAVVDAAPAALDTLNELAAALGDDASFASTVTTALAGKAADSAVVKLTGDQTIGGTKTFTVAPAVPDAAFAIAKVSGLDAALAAKADASALTTLSATVSTLSSNVGDTTTNFVTTFEAGLV